MSADSGTRERLLNAAINLIESEGESAVRVDRVVALAGFTKPVLYHHFADKDDVIVQAQAERYRQSLEWANAGISSTVGALRSKEDFEVWLTTVISGFATDESRRQRQIRNEVIGSSVSRPELRLEVATLNQAFVTWLEQEIERWHLMGWTHPMHPSRDLAEWWAVQIHGLYLMEVGRRDDSRSSTWVDVLMSAVRHLLGL